MKLPKGKKFKVVYADPPWLQETWSEKGKEGRPQHYKRMTLAEIKALPVEDVVADDCWLFLWTTGPHLQQAFDVIKAWGFKYSGMGFVWVKMDKNSMTLFFDANEIFMGGGYTTRKNTEFCLLARRGKPKRLAKDVHEVIIEARREHSRKPEDVYKRIERFAVGPYLEMFARNRRKGWSSAGNEVDKFPASKT